ncbi:hypothetical protein HMPREF1978_00366 [Actinomyces graevenitzii F0530]|uniref:Uncharacterized protein n=1 Tax=Actinomyces graevenitzii F0530 TaxID=1321817 RepID=U1Q7N7_9ACTO|nr:hypothetical protein HMPREF1978_00366 [Actinomyces graevenitzii F0530]
MLKSQNQIFPRRGTFSSPNPTPAPLPGGWLSGGSRFFSDALKSPVLI